MEHALWFRVDSKQLCKASFKTCLSHVFGCCSYLYYYLETLNSSLPHSRIKTKRATKLMGKTSLTWGVGCPVFDQTDSNSEQGSSTDTHPHTQTGNPRTWKTAKTYLKLHPNNGACGTKEERTLGAQVLQDKGKVFSPHALLWGNHITPVPGTNSHLTALTSTDLSWLAWMGDQNTALQSKFYFMFSYFNANNQEILCSQVLLGHITLITPDQLLLGSDCLA